MAKIITVYINGTNERITGISDHSGPIALVNLLHNITQQTENHASYCLEGCAVNTPDPRDIEGMFTFNLESQLDCVVDDIRNKLSFEIEKIILNIVGFGRGGAGAFWLCQKLKDIPANKVEINVCALEPVPGNFISASYLDNISGLKTTLTGQIADLSDCKNVTKMLVLFTNQAMRDIAFHAPILPIKPVNAEMTIDVIPGCHINAQYYYYNKKRKDLDSMNDYSIMMYHYVTKFLISCGTKFKLDVFTSEYIIPNEYLISIFDRQNKAIKKQTRSMHFYNEINSKEEQPYLNLLHKELITNQKPNDSSGCALSVKNPNPQASYENGQKSNTYFPTLAKAAGTIGIGSALYYTPLRGVLALAAVGTYFYKHHEVKKKLKL